MEVMFLVETYLLSPLQQTKTNTTKRRRTLQNREVFSLATNKVEAIKEEKEQRGGAKEERKLKTCIYSNVLYVQWTVKACKGYQFFLGRSFEYSGEETLDTRQKKFDFQLLPYPKNEMLRLFNQLSLLAL